MLFAGQGPLNSVPGDEQGPLNNNPLNMFIELKTPTTGHTERRFLGRLLRLAFGGWSAVLRRLVLALRRLLLLFVRFLHRFLVRFLFSLFRLLLLFPAGQLFGALRRRFGPPVPEEQRGRQDNDECGDYDEIHC